MFSVSMPKADHLGGIGGDGHEVLGQVGLLPCCRNQARADGVEHGFLGGEGFGGDDEQRGLGIDAGGTSSRSWPSTLETKCAFRRAWRRRAGRCRPSAGPGAADADVDDVGDLASGVAAPLAAAHALGESRMCSSTA
jgi:hypothetical protein